MPGYERFHWEVTPDTNIRKAAACRMTDRTHYTKDVFICYASGDRRWVESVLLPRLEAAGLKTLIDYRDFKLGVPQLENIEDAVDTSRHTLLVITPDWLKSGWNQFQSLLIQTTDPAGRLRRLIPLLLMPTQLPARIAVLTYADFTGTEEQGEAEMQRLLPALMTRSRVFLSFLRTLEPDSSLALRLRDALEGEGHSVFTDEDAAIGTSYRIGVHNQIDRSDYVVVLLSASSVRDNTILDQVERAHTRSSSSGGSRLLPIRIAFNESLPDVIDGLLKGIGYGYWSSEADDEKIVRKLLDAMSNLADYGPAVAKAGQLTPDRSGVSAKLWPNGSVLSVGFLEGEPSVRWEVVKTASEWMEHANLRFVFGNRADACIRISFQEAGSWSLIGTDALIVPQNQPTINLGWLNTNTSAEEVRRVVLHEFGHVLGLVHEHQIANALIPWNTEAVYRFYAGPPNFWTKQEVEAMMFQKYERDYFPLEKDFDPQSIMLFPINRELTDGSFQVGVNNTLSDGDKAFVKKLYPSA
jgi:TIR domain